MVFNDGSQKGIVQIYVPINREIGFLTSLMLILIATGALSITVLVSIGWVMAGRALVPIRKAWQRQKDFIADASHELRTPLTVVQTNLEILLGKKEETIQENIKWVENIKEEVVMMSKLVKDLLFLARVDAKQIKLKKEMFDISVLAEAAVSKARLIAGDQLKINKKIQPNVKFFGDKIRIKQLLTILMDNAVKYTMPLGSIFVKLYSDKHNVYIEIKDTGIGIDKKDQERIFDRFYRVDKARSRAKGGTGLGLSIASWIVEEHDGKIQLNSEPNKGSCFTIVLPIHF